MTIDGASGLIQWTPAPTAAQSNPHTVRITVSDPAGHTAAQIYGIFARATNEPPTIDSDPITASVEGEVYQYDVEASDPDGDTLTYSLTAAPGGMAISAATGLVAWLVPQTAAAEGPHAVTVVVTDGVEQDEQSFNLAPDEVNVAPTINSTPVTQAAVGAVYEYDVEAADADGDAVIYALDTAPAGMTIDANTGLIDWAPVPGQEGDRPVTVQASDPYGLTDAQSFIIDTAECPDAPQFTSTPKTTASPSMPYQYDVDATTQSGTITFELAVSPEGMAIDANLGLITWTPVEAQMGVHDVTIVATRDDFCPSEQSFQIDVRDCELVVSHDPPPLAPGFAVTIVPEVQSNCEPLSFEFMTAPESMEIDSATGVIDWVPVLGLYAVEVQVTDCQRRSENAVNRPV